MEEETTLHCTCSAASELEQYAQEELSRNIARVSEMELDSHSHSLGRHRWEQHRH